MISEEDCTSQETSDREAGSQESCEWDNFQEASSYFEPLDETVVEKDTRLNSTTDNLLLDKSVDLGVKGPLESTSSEIFVPEEAVPTEEEEREIFHVCGDASEKENMSPKTKSPAQLYEDFGVLLNSWKNEVARSGKKKSMPQFIADELEEKFQGIISISDQISKADY